LLRFLVLALGTSNFIPEQCYLDGTAFSQVQIFSQVVLGRYFKHVISVAAVVRSQIEWSDSKYSNIVNQANLEQEVLVGLTYFYPAYPELFLDWNLRF
jgi:hypothetical protein